MPKKDKNIILLYLAILSFSFGYGFIIFLYPLYAKSLGANSFQIGVLYSLMTLWMALSAIPGGWLADRFEPKKIIVYSWLFLIPGSLIYFLAQNWIHLAIADFIVESTFLNSPAVSLYVLRKTPAHKLGEAFSFVTSAYPLGIAITPLLGGWLADNFGLRTVFFLPFVFNIISSGFVLFLENIPAPKRETRLRHPLKSLKFVLVILFFSWLLATEYIYVPFFPAFLKEVKGLSYTMVGLIASFLFLVNALLTPQVGKLMDRLGIKRVLIFITLLYSLSLFLALKAESIFSLLLIALLLGIARQYWTISTVVTGKLVEGMSEGMAFGILNFSRTGITFFAPIIGGWLDGINPAYPLIAPAIIFLLSVPAILAWPKISSKIPD